MLRVKDITESTNPINEAEIRDATPQFQQLMDMIGGTSSIISQAYGEVSCITEVARQTLNAITSATNAAHSIGDNSNAIIDNINAVQNADQSQSIITLSDHKSGVQQAFNILSSIVSSLRTAASLCGKLNQLASKQFLKT